jgi:hypothetical protein
MAARAARLSRRLCKGEQANFVIGASTPIHHGAGRSAPAPHWARRRCWPAMMKTLQTASGVLGARKAKVGRARQMKGQSGQVLVDQEWFSEAYRSAPLARCGELHGRSTGVGHRTVQPWPVRTVGLRPSRVVQTTYTTGGRTSAQTAITR